VRGHSLPCGHYLAEEMADETCAALKTFLLDKESEMDHASRLRPC